MMQLTKKQEEASGRLLASHADNRIFWSDDGKIAEVMTTGIAGGLDKALKGHSIHITPKGVFRTFSEAAM
jgi:hypothetical protein